ncbi:MAG: hypothetical protein MJ252_19515, partial [archaeon]|nr:hypothetical protein [archaeon]
MNTSSIKYSFLNEMNKDASYDFYGVIFDSSFPVLIKNPSEDNDFYEINIKLIDPSINSLNEDNKEKYLTLNIKSQIKEGIPYIHKIGDIIRIHKGNYSTKNKTVSLILTNITKRFSEWTLLSGFEENDLEAKEKLIEGNKDSLKLLQSSNTNPSFEAQDKDIIKEIRKWIGINFQLKNSLNYSNDIKLNKKIKGNKDNECSLIQIENKVEFPDYVKYVISDETKRSLLFTNKYFNFLEAGNVLRLTNYFMKEDDEIYLRQSSNILIVPKFSDLFKTFKNNINRNIEYLNKNYRIEDLLTKKNENNSNEDKLIELGIEENNKEMTENKNNPQSLKSEEKMSIENLENKFNSEFPYENILTQFGIEKNGAVDVKFIKLLYPSSIENIIFNLKKRKDSQRYFYHFVFLGKVKEKDQEIIFHLNNFDDQGKGLLIEEEKEKMEKERLSEELSKNIKNLLNYGGFIR